MALVFRGSLRIWAIDSTDAPVSTAVELATLVMRALRYWAGAFKCGFVSMSGFVFIATGSPLVKLYAKTWIETITI